MANLTQPVVDWYWDYKEIGTGTVKQDKVGLYGTGGGTLGLWDMGTVKAGNASTSDDTARSFYIWNNKANGTDVAPTMADCQLTIRDDDDTTNGYHQGNADSPMVKEEWIQARVRKSRKGATGTEADPYESVGAWTPIGLNPDGHTVDYLDFEAVGMRATGSTDTFSVGQISGTTNTGAFDTDACRNNFAKVDMKMVVPSGALAGMTYFIARIYYTAV
jgi:hypothetical protein